MDKQVISKREEAIKIYAESRKRWAEGDTFSLKLWDEGNKLRVKGNKLWNEELIRLFGFIPDFMKNIEDYVEP